MRRQNGSGTRELGLKVENNTNQTPRTLSDPSPTATRIDFHILLRAYAQHGQIDAIEDLMKARFFRKSLLFVIPSVRFFSLFFSPPIIGNYLSDSIDLFVSRCSCVCHFPLA